MLSPQAPAQSEDIDDTELPDYMQNWDLMEPVFSLYNTELGNYIVDWSWNQEDAEGVVYYLEEAANQDFLNANITTHYDTDVLMTGKPNGTYWYRVRAVKGNLSSDWSQPDSITISIQPLDDAFFVIGDSRFLEEGRPYEAEKIEFFLNVPLVVVVGEDPENRVNYTITLRECTSSDFYNVSVLEVSYPNQFIIVTSEESEIDIDLDGTNDMTVKFKMQHELGQVYIYFNLIQEPESVIPYSTIGVVLAVILALSYMVFILRQKGKIITTNGEVEELPNPSEDNINTIVYIGVEYI